MWYILIYWCTKLYTNQICVVPKEMHVINIYLHIYAHTPRREEGLRNLSSIINTHFEFIPVTFRSYWCWCLVSNLLRLSSLDIPHYVSTNYVIYVCIYVYHNPLSNT